MRTLVYRTKEEQVPLCPIRGPQMTHDSTSPLVCEGGEGRVEVRGQGPRLP